MYSVQRINKQWQSTSIQRERERERERERASSLFIQALTCICLIVEVVAN